MALGPMFFWLPELTLSISWDIIYLLLTVQKIAPLSVLAILVNFCECEIILGVGVSRILIGRIIGNNEYSTRKLLIYSSLIHSGWLVSRIVVNKYDWMVYMFIYIVMFAYTARYMENKIISRIRKQKLNRVAGLNFLSLRGLPPFAGFYLKWIVLEGLINQGKLLCSIIIVLGGSLRLYFYLRVGIFLLRGVKKINVLKGGVFLSVGWAMMAPWILFKLI